MSTDPEIVPDGIAEIIPQQIPVSAIHDNSSAELVTITVDRLNLIIVRHEGSLGSNKAWQTPLGMFIGMISVIFVSDFKSFGSISSDTIKAFFWFSTFGLLIWTVRDAWYAWKRGAVGDLVEKIKRGQAD